MNRQVVYSEYEISRLNQSIDALYTSLNKVLQPNPVLTSTFHVKEQKEPAIFLKHEIILFSHLTKTQVIKNLNDIGIDVSSVSITTDGPPLFFSSTLTNDKTSFPDYFLNHADLPYGFASEDGTFQFSSPEISRLKKSIGPHVINDAYYYLGTDGDQISYDALKNPDDAWGVRPISWGLGWCKWRTKQTILSDISLGRVDNILANISYKLPGNKTYIQHFADKEEYANNIRAGPSLYEHTGIYGGLGNHYNPSKFFGWSYGTYTYPTLGSRPILRPLLKMPPSQYPFFEVNPQPQQPYRGAEGVYSVIMVEFNKDLILDV